MNYLKRGLCFLGLYITSHSRIYFCWAFLFGGSPAVYLLQNIFRTVIYILINGKTTQLYKHAGISKIGCKSQTGCMSQRIETCSKRSSSQARLQMSFTCTDKKQYFLFFVSKISPTYSNNERSLEKEQQHHQDRWLHRPRPSQRDQPHCRNKDEKKVTNFFLFS